VIWRTSKRTIDLAEPAVMGILNVTPDSFSDGGRFASLDAAVRRAEEMISEGADIIDIGGESTRPGSRRVGEAEEIDRVAPIIETISARFDIPVSIDTTKAAVAEASIMAGAEIINDISGLRFNPRIADVAAHSNSGLILMHSRGDFETMHSQPPVEDIFLDVSADFERSLHIARSKGVKDDHIVLDIGLGFGKTVEQNLSLIANIDRLTSTFPKFPVLVGASRKSFIGKVVGTTDADDRLAGSLACAVIAEWNGAAVLRVHDVRETVGAVRMASALVRNARSSK
jgi:dihydropteroate synthase